jgi:peptidoglycan-associated lipoprotein
MERKWLIGILVVLLVMVEFGCAGRRGRRAERRKGVTEEETEIREVPLVTRIGGEEFIDVPELVDVYFEFDKSQLLPREKESLKENAAWLSAHPKVKVLIEGHCDERGTREYNLALGERRALSVRAYLASLGIDSQRLFTISYGEDRPLDPGDNEEAWAKNRRAHLKISR